MEYLEFIEQADEEGDTEYVFHPIGSHSKSKYNSYNVFITVNELGEELDGTLPIVKIECNCNAFRIYKKECKHLIDAKNILLKRGIKLNNNMKLVRYWCPNCKQEIETLSGCDLVCRHCKYKMIEAKNEPRPKKKKE